MARYNEQQLTEKVKQLSKEMFGWEMNKPVIIDGRLTRTWASAHFRKNNATSKIELKCFKFAKRFVSGDYREEDIISTIKHELLHWYTNVTENVSCGHDWRWKNNCRKFGVTPEACSGHQKINNNNNSNDKTERKSIKQEALRQERPLRRDYIKEITLNSVSGIIDFANKKGIEVERYDGSLIDNYILYADDKMTLKGVKPRKYIILKEKAKNSWSSITELVMTDDINKVEEFLDLVS